MALDGKDLIKREREPWHSRTSANLLVIIWILWMPVGTLIAVIAHSGLVFAFLLFLWIMTIPICGFLAEALRRETAEEVLARDRRAPVLFLRPFVLDRLSRRPSMGELAAGQDEKSFEETFVALFRSIGPVIAVGRPGERFLVPGVARWYVDGDHWQRAVLDRLKQANAVVLMLGETGGLTWEFQSVVAHVNPCRFLLGIPTRRRKQYTKLCELANCHLPQPLPAWEVGDEGDDGGRSAEFFAFDRDWTPVLMPRVCRKYNFFQWERNYEISLRPFIQRLELLNKEEGRVV